MFWGLILLWTAPAYLGNIGSTDLWKHLQTGRYLRLFNRFPHYSSFLYSPVRDFVPGDSYDWLGSVLIHEIYTWTGFIGLSAFKIVVFLLILILIGRLLERRGVTSFVLLVIAGFSLEPRLLVRAALFGPLFFTLLVYLWLRSRTYVLLLWLVPPLMVLWGNLHGSFALGYVFLFGAIFGRLRNESIPVRETVLPLIVTVVAVPIVKPFPHSFLYEKMSSVTGNLILFVVQIFRDTSKIGTGWGVSLEWIRDGLFDQRVIVAPEFQPTFYHFRYFSDYAFWGGLALLVVCFLSKKVDWERLGPLVLLGLIGISINRAAPYFLIALLMTMGRDLEKMVIIDAGNGSDFPPGLPESFSSVKRLVMSLLTLVILISVLRWGQKPAEGWLFKNKQYGFGLVSRFANETTTDFLAEGSGGSRIYSNVRGVSAYLLFRLWPRFRTMDYGKTEAWPRNFQEDLMRRKSQGDFEGLADRYKISAAVIFGVRSRQWAYWRNREGWKQVYEDLRGRIQVLVPSSK